jgi:hypothetical protein
MKPPQLVIVLNNDHKLAMEIAAIADDAILNFEAAMQNFKSFGLAGMPKISAKRRALVDVLKEKVNPLLGANNFPEVNHEYEPRLREFCREYVVGTVNFPRMHLPDFWDRWVRAGFINQLYERVENKVIYSDLQPRHV